MVYQQQEQITVLQILIAQVKLEEEEVAVVPQPNTRPNIKVVKPQTFNRATNKMLDFLASYRLYIRMRMRDITVEK